MAEASISVDQDQFSCPVCLDLLKDPVTIHCGHSFCMVCINGCWNEEDQRGVYSCPQCRETFTPRPVLRRNNMMAEMLEKVKKTELQAAPPAHCYAGPGDVECDFCTGRKRKAIKSCLVCLVSYCEAHLKPHYQSPTFKKHKLVKASTRLQERICSQHDKLMEIYCRTDQSCICYLCMMHEHKGHDTAAAAAERKKKQNQLKEVQRKSWQRLQQKEKKLQELKQAVVTLKRSAQAAVEDSERIFTELIRSIEKKRSEVTELIRTQEKNQLRQTGELLRNLQQEIDDLKRRNTELEQLSVTEDHIHFLQIFQSLRVSSGCGCEDSSSITVHQHPSLDGVRKSLSDLKERLEEFCKEEFSKVSPHAAAVQTILSSEPKTREDFLQYFCRLTLDPNTVNHQLRLCEQNRVVTYRGGGQSYSDYPERFEHWNQVLCTESVSGRCYWEVEWSREEWGLLTWVSISVSYKGISRKGRGHKCRFGHNNQSWSLRCSDTLTFWHNNIQTELSAPSSSRIGVYVDHSAGTLSFYSVSDTMTLLHTVHTTFTQPLCAGFEVGLMSLAKLCDSVMKHR
ncbi:tripartite motif-containing protein 16-like [Colossoma macropomum]|uniref:tripartite motif-containing protein 16-like n=1 Tax=Colossoma macropomum TaxID=42526 RepID=UPI001863CE4B|nr:tripartite motif-containing protein 16-like [Colossoma macropomum]